MGVDFYELRDRERGTKVKISEVYRPKVRVSRDDRIEEKIDGREGGDKGGGRNGGFEAVAAGRASHAPVDPRS